LPAYPGLERQQERDFLGAPERLRVLPSEMKGFWVKEGRAILQVGVEAFNLLNYSNALQVSPFFSSGAGQLGSRGEALETLNARQIRLMVQFE